MRVSVSVNVSACVCVYVFRRRVKDERCVCVRLGDQLRVAGEVHQVPSGFDHIGGDFDLAWGRSSPPNFVAVLTAYGLMAAKCQAVSNAFRGSITSEVSFALDSTRSFALISAKFGLQFTNVGRAPSNIFGWMFPGPGKCSTIVRQVAPVLRGVLGGTSRRVPGGAGVASGALVDTS